MRSNTVAIDAPVRPIWSDSTERSIDTPCRTKSQSDPWTIAAGHPKGRIDELLP